MNENLLGQLDLSGNTAAGDVGVFAGYYAGDEVAGYATAFEDFSVRSVE